MNKNLQVLGVAIVMIVFGILVARVAAQTITGPGGYSNDAAATCFLPSAATTNSTNCKASAANLYGVSLINTTTTVYYLRLYNASSAPTCSSSTGYVESLPAPPGASSGLVGGLIRAWSWPQAFPSGLSFCFTGGGGSTDNTNAATGVYIALEYR